MLRIIIYKFYKFFLKKNYILSLGILFLLMYLLPLIIVYPLNFYVLKGSDFVSVDTLDKYDLIRLCLISPIIETFVFQFLIFQFFNFVEFRNVFLKIIIASVIFGMFHYYNWIYILYAFCLGIVLNFTYAYTIKKFRNLYIPFIVVASFHIIKNTIAFFSSKIFI